MTHDDHGHSKSSSTPVENSFMKTFNSLTAIFDGPATLFRGKEAF